MSFSAAAKLACWRDTTLFILCRSDPRLKWDPAQWNQTAQLVVPLSQIWAPDIVVYETVATSDVSGSWSCRLPFCCVFAGLGEEEKWKPWPGTRCLILSLVAFLLPDWAAAHHGLSQRPVPVAFPEGAVDRVPDEAVKFPIRHTALQLYSGLEQLRFGGH